MLALRDGTIVTKDLRLEGQGGTTLTRLEPESLELVGEPLVLPEGSMGRIAADVVDIDGATAELVYVPGTEHLWRLFVGESGGTDGGPPSDDLVVVDVATGSLIDRVPTGSRVANGMFLSAAAGRRVLYASTTAVALAAWT